MGPEFGLWGAKMYMIVLSHCLPPLLVNFGLDLPVHVQCGSFLFIWWFWGLVLGFGRGGRTQQGGKSFPQIRKPRTPHPQTTRHILLSLRLPQLCGAWGPPQD